MFCISKSYHCMRVLQYKSSCNNLWSSFKLTNESSIIIRKSHSIFWNNISLGFHILFFWFYIVNKCQRVLNLRSVRKPTVVRQLAMSPLFCAMRSHEEWEEEEEQWEEEEEAVVAHFQVIRLASHDSGRPNTLRGFCLVEFSDSLIHCWRVAWRICTVFIDGVEWGVSLLQVHKIHYFFFLWWIIYHLLGYANRSI